MMATRRARRRLRQHCRDETHYTQAIRLAEHLASGGRLKWFAALELTTELVITGEDQIFYNAWRTRT